MGKYCSAAASGTPSTTAATAGIWKVEGAATNPRVTFIAEHGLFPSGAAADNNYTVNVKRQTTAGTWTGVTPAPLQSTDPAALAVCGRASTAAGSAVSNSVIGRFGFNHRAGYRWVAVPGFELVIPATAAAGIIGEYSYAQGTDTMDFAVYFEE